MTGWLDLLHLQLETVQVLEQGAAGAAVRNTAATLAIGIAAAVTGLGLGLL